MAQKIHCNRNWRFSDSFESHMIHQTIENPKLVDIPYMFIEADADENKQFCLQKSICMPNQWNTEIIELVFEAVFGVVDIYINAKQLIHCDGKGNRISIDVSKAIEFGKENIITIRFGTESNVSSNILGISENIFFLVKHELHIQSVFVSPLLLEKVSTNRRTATQIKLMKTQGIVKCDCFLSKSVFDAAINERLFIRQYLDNNLLFSQPVGGLDSTDEGYRISLSSAPLTVKLWDIESPSLYDVKTQLVLDGEIIDEDIQKIGFRKCSFNKVGFLINGRRLKLRGITYESDYLKKGMAISESLLRYDAKIIKEELQFNAVRITDVNVSKNFVEECASMGILVFFDIPEDVALNDERLAEVIRAYRNNPAIVAWGLHYKQVKKSGVLEKIQQLDSLHAVFGNIPNSTNEIDYKQIYACLDHRVAGIGDKLLPDIDLKGEPFIISGFFPGRYLKDVISDLSDVYGDFSYANMIKQNIEVLGGFREDFSSSERGVVDFYRNTRAEFFQLFDKENVRYIVPDSFKKLLKSKFSYNLAVFSNADSIRLFLNDDLVGDFLPIKSRRNLVDFGCFEIDRILPKNFEFSRKLSDYATKMLITYINSCFGSHFSHKLINSVTGFILRTKYNLSEAEVFDLFELKSSKFRFEFIKDEQICKSIFLSSDDKPRIVAEASHTLLTEINSFDMALIRIKAVDEYGVLLKDFNKPLKIKVSGPFELLGPDVVTFSNGCAGVIVKSQGEAASGAVALSCEGCDAISIAISCECLRK